MKYPSNWLIWSINFLSSTFLPYNERGRKKLSSNFHKNRMIYGRSRNEKRSKIIASTTVAGQDDEASTATTDDESTALGAVAALDLRRRTPTLPVPVNLLRGRRWEDRAMTFSPRRRRRRLIWKSRVRSRREGLHDDDACEHCYRLLSAYERTPQPDILPLSISERRHK